VLTAARGVHAFFPGDEVRSYGISAPMLGPVIRLHRGETTGIRVENALSRVTTLHWHGLIVPGDVDGGPHNVVAPGASWDIELTVDQPEATAWYHAHPHGETAEQVYAGLAGMLIVEDGSGETLGMPRDYGIDDLPLILQDRYFDRTGAPVYDPRPMEIMAGYRGDTFVVNGVVSPVARVPAGIVRLRLLNGANARIFDLAFSDGRSFNVVASDGGYLESPVERRGLLVAPAERYEILVDFSDGAAVVLETGPDQNIPMMGMMGSGAAADGGPLMRFEVDPTIVPKVSALPQKLVALPRLDPSSSAGRRAFQLNDMMMGGMGGMMGRGRGGGRLGPSLAINDRPFDMARIDFETRRGTMETWRISGQMMAHPFHVHGTQFQILSLAGRPPPPHLRGWKDTVLVAPEAEILVPFAQAAPREFPYMFHCHILEHEDAGMMGQFSCL